MAWFTRFGGKFKVYQSENQRPDNGSLAYPELRILNHAFATFTISTSQKIVNANDRFCRQFGYEHDEIIGRSIDRIFNTESDKSDFWEKVENAQNSTSNLSSEHTLRKKDASIVWVKSHSLIQRDEDGNLIEVTLVLRDITSEKMQAADDRGQINAINKSQAVVQFALDGTILEANNLFLDVMGYQREEVINQHHCMFVSDEYAESTEYKKFWNMLSEGEFHSDEFKRVSKDGTEVWLQATYNPIFDPNGQVMKVIKYATNVTNQKLTTADYEWQIKAIHKSQCVVSFDMHGTILDANDIFLNASGYTLQEVQGRHHRMFVEQEHSHSLDYAMFWRDLRKGLHRAGQYTRISKDGEKMWLQATYNPVFDPTGKPFKVVKYASIVTDTRLLQAEYQGQIAAIHKAQSVISFDLEGNILDANENFLKTMGYKYSEVRGQHHNMFVDEETANSQEYKDFWQTLSKGKYYSSEFRRFSKTGKEVWLQATYNPIFDMGGKPFKVVKYATDITEEKTRNSVRQGQIDAIARSQDILTLSLDGIIQDANDNLLKTMGYRRDEVIGQHHSIFVPPEDVETAEYREFWQRLKSGSFHAGMYKRVRKDGREVWLQATYNSILDLNDQPVKIIKFATDVSENIALSQAYEDARTQAQHDTVTSLPNRNRLAHFMSSNLASPGSRLVVLFIDLDKFKPVNDNFGHEVGDYVLKKISERLSALLNDDQLVARVGGDEFVIALPNMPDDQIVPLCNKILDAVRKPIRHAVAELSISASIGIAISPADGTTSEELLRSADAALYRSKDAGRDAYSFYASDLNEKINTERKLIENMRRGLSENEFFLEYQPRFDTREKTIQSVEALVRWEHPDMGRIGPNEFIPVAEKCGLINQLGEWILRTAINAATHWPGVGVSVNISPAQLKKEGLAALIEDALNEAGLEANRLEIEITEAVLVESPEIAAKELDKIKKLGVRLSIDDFGSGQSPLVFLRNLPLDAIKIDKQFISEMAHNADDRAVVQAIVALGKALGMSVTAEGVETNEQLAMLTHEHCGEVQGFLLSKPVQANKLQQLFEELPELTNGNDDTAAVPDARLAIEGL